MPWGCEASLWNTVRAQLRQSESYWRSQLEGWELTQNVPAEAEHQVCAPWHNSHSEVSVLSSIITEWKGMRRPDSSQGSTWHGWDKWNMEIPPWYRENIFLVWFLFGWGFLPRALSTNGNRCLNTSWKIHPLKVSKAWLDAILINLKSLKPTQIQSLG